jgi:CBS domain containing-hemolysin-like protein
MKALMGYSKNMPQSTLKHALVLGLGAFFLAIVLSLLSQSLLSKIKSIFPALLLLLIIVLLGIVFDIIGTAVTKASESAFHAKAARKITGAKEAVALAKNADKVASFCNDVVGDISGTLSGAIGAAIVIRLASWGLGLPEVLLSTLMTASIAGITIGGKGLGKNYALREAEAIIFKVGQLIAFLSRGIFLSQNRKAPKRGK